MKGATPEDVFAAVAREAAKALDLPLVEMQRCEPDGDCDPVIGATASIRSSLVRTGR